MSVGDSFTGGMFPLCVYFKSGKSVLTASSRSVGLLSIFRHPIKIGCPFFSPVPGVNCRRNWRTSINLGACCVKLLYPKYIPLSGFILVSVMLLSVNSISILFRVVAFCISTPIPVEGKMLCPINHLAAAISSVSFL